jgi:hypothetical protein
MLHREYSSAVKIFCMDHLSTTEASSSGHPLQLESQKQSFEVPQLI